MHNMCSSNGVVLLEIGTLRLGAIVGPALILTLVINVEVAETNTSFWRFQAVVGIMACFVIVKIRDYTDISIWVFLVLALLLTQLSRLYYINSTGGGRAFLRLVSVLVAPIFFLLFLSNFKACGVVKVLGSWLFWDPDFRFFCFRVFYWLGLSFGRDSIYQLVALVALLINITTGKGLHFGFDLILDCFFD